MDTPHSDLEAIRQILADLTTRVYRIERRLQMEAPAVQRPPPRLPKLLGLFRRRRSRPLPVSTRRCRLPLQGPTSRPSRRLGELKPTPTSNRVSARIG